MWGFTFSWQSPSRCELTPCSLEDGDERFTRIAVSVFREKDGGKWFLRNAFTYLPNYAASP
jgi:hypothetical protein